MMMLDPKGREAARLWAIEAASDGGVPGDNYIDGILTAYLSTVTPAEVGGPVAKLRQCADDPMWADHAEVPKQWLSEAVTALEAQAAELAAVKTALDCALIRECNEKHRAKIAHQSMNAAINTRERAEAALAETRKALDRMVALYESEYDPDLLPARPAWLQEIIARRALTGGREDDQ